MSVETISKRLTTQVGDTLVVTDVKVCQRILPARVWFEDIRASIEVKPETGMVFVNFEGYEDDLFYGGDYDILAVKRQLALQIAGMLEADGVVVYDKPK